MILIINNFLWSWLWVLILITSIVSFIKYQKIKNKNYNMTLEEKKNNKELFFVSMAGSIGLGNVFTVIEGVQSSGPGVIVWLWVGALLGRYLKFWELYLSLQEKNSQNHNITGPMIYIKKIFINFPYLGQYLSLIFSIISIFYSMEIYQFGSMSKLITRTIIHYGGPMNYSMVLYIVALILFGGLLYCRNRDEFINSSNILMKIFLWGYFSCLLLLSIKYYYILPLVFKNIFYSIFSYGHWSGKILAVTTGIRTAIYSNDIGVGYEGTMQTFASVKKSNIVEYCSNIIKSNIVDVMVCTTSGLLALIYLYGNNLSLNSFDSQSLIINIFNSLLPGGQLILTFLIFCAAFTTVCTLCQSGILIIQYQWSRINYNFFYIVMFSIFFLGLSFKLETLFNIMTFSGGLLITINCLVILKYLLTIKNEKN